MRLTDRDIELLQAFGRFRFLSSDQVRRLFFPSKQTAQRRLKLLYHSGYLERFEPIQMRGSGSEDLVYALTDDGLSMARAEAGDIPAYGALKDFKPLFLKHALHVSEFRLLLELAPKKGNPFSIREMVIDSELKRSRHGFKGKDRMRMFFRLSSPSAAEYIVHPDITVMLTRADDPSVKRTWCVEVDEGTESHETILKKLTGYKLALESSVFADGRVLIVTTTQKRMENLRKSVAEHTLAPAVALTSWDTLRHAEVLHDPIWSRANGQKIALMKRMDTV